MTQHIELIDVALNAAADTLNVSVDSESLEDQAKMYQEAIRSLFAQNRVISQAILYAMWKIHSQGLLSFLGYDPEDPVWMWAVDQYSDLITEGYIRDLCRIVEVIFTDVYAREIQNSPYRDSNGEAITVDLLLSRPGLLRKLGIVSSAYGDVTRTKAEREKLLDSVLHKGRKAVIADRDEIVTGSLPIKFRYKTTHTPSGRVTVMFQEMTDDEQYALLALLGEAGEEVFA